MPDVTGMSVAMFKFGNFHTAPSDYPKDDWKNVRIPGAVGHSWSDEGMLSPDGTLAAFPYWEVNPGQSGGHYDREADRHFFLAIVRTDGSDVRKYPNIVLPSQMCWTRDNSKLAMIAHLARDSSPQLIVLDLDSGTTDQIRNGKNVALTPQCWSPDRKRLTFFVGDQGMFRPGSIRIFDTEIRESRDLLRDDTKCKENSFCESPFPTWSPDGEWIAYYQRKAYWVMHPSGDGRKKLFRKWDLKSVPISPLQWSPDMRYVLYADCCAFRDTLHCMCEIGRIRVRRLVDNADVEISTDGYQNMYTPRWTWVQTTRMNPKNSP